MEESFTPGKNGLAALFLIFCLFDVSGELVKDKQDYNDTLLVAGGLSIIVYVVLKFLKYNTTLLTENPNSKKTSSILSKG